MLNPKIVELIINHRPKYDWVNWAAFDKTNSSSHKLCFYEFEPELRSDYWFSSKGRTCSFNIMVNKFYNWNESLIKISPILGICEKEKRIQELRTEISGLNNRLYLAKNEMLFLMRQK